MVADSADAATERTPSKNAPPAPTLGGPPVPPAAGPATPGWRTKVSSASISVFFGKFCVIGRKIALRDVSRR